MVKTVKEIQKLIDSIKEVDDMRDGKFREDYERVFKWIIIRRLVHCAELLEQHIKEAKKSPMGLIVFWEGGHFSLPVYEALEEALHQNKNEWTPLIWEQILRQMFEEDNRDKELFYYATEMLLCKE